MRWKRIIGLGLLGAAGAAAVWYAQPKYPMPDADLACLAGAYALEDGRVVTLNLLTSGNGLRWRLPDGRSSRISRGDSGAWTGRVGWTDTADSTAVETGSCSDGALRLDNVGGKRVALSTQDTRFAGDGVELAGRLLLPPGDTPVPVAVLVHGSEDWPALTYGWHQYHFAANGIGAFVYDKRGTGASSGKYSQNFNLLAGDAAAALREARRLAGARASRVGFMGGSQAGWIIPLAAARTDTDFAAVAYGLAGSPLDEDRDQVLLDLRRAGHGEDVLAKAREVTAATGAVMASGFQEGYDALADVTRRYGDEPWWKDMRGEFTGELIGWPAWVLRVVGPMYDVGTSWKHDPLPPLLALKPPLLWIIAGADREAPPEQTRERLLDVARRSNTVTLAEFPDTDHGILEFEQAADGSRRMTRASDGYFRLLLDWIRDGEAGNGPYGRAQLLVRPTTG
jgi:hypothetical protein